MLKKRVVTALLLMSVFLGMLFFTPASVFISFCGLVFLVGAWEWARLSGFSGRLTPFLYAACLAAIACVSAYYFDWASKPTRLQLIFTSATIWWGVALLWVQGYPSSAVLWKPVWVRVLLGALILIPAWYSVMYIRNMANGQWIVLLVLLIVAAADVGAYFSGRAFGRVKLAPAVSPGKSWEGVIGGALLAVVIAAGYVLLVGHSAHSPVSLVVVLVVALISVVGDLLESMVKRVSGVKDSSNLLPGHGGVLDRIDGLVAALPVLSLSFLLSEWQL